MTRELTRQKDQPAWHELELGAAVVCPGSARACLTGDWRSTRPTWRYVADSTGCVQCGMCTVYCPEGCIAMVRLSETGFDVSLAAARPRAGLGAESLVPAADLTYCKGCGICAHECPTACIVMVPEER